MVQSVCHPVRLPVGVLLNRLSGRDTLLEELSSGGNRARCWLNPSTHTSITSKNNSCLCKKVFISPHKSVFTSRVNACVHIQAPSAGRSDSDERVKPLKQIRFHMLICALSPQGNCPKVSSINDRNDWKVVRKALTVIGFNEDEVEVNTRTLHMKPPRLGLHQCIVGVQDISTAPHFQPNCLKSVSQGILLQL